MRAPRRPRTALGRFAHGLGVVIAVTVAAGAALVGISDSGVVARSEATALAPTAAMLHLPFGGLATAGAGAELATVAQAATRTAPAEPTAEAAAAAPATEAGHPAATTAAAGPGTIAILGLAAPGETTAHRAVYVYRPAVTDSATLPVLYFLHGVPGSPGDPFAAGLATYLDRAFARGVAPFVVVSPDGNGAAHDDSEWADAWNGSDRIESFLLDVVIPAVEGTNRRDAAHRAVGGDSMGGYGAMNISMRHPGVFGQVVSIAGYFHVDDPAAMFGGQAALIDANSPDRHPAEARGLHILLLDGTAESDPVIRGESERMSDLLDSAGVANRLVIAPGDDTWQFASSQFGTITDFVDQGWAGA